MSCMSCASDNEAEFNGEININFLVPEGQIRTDAIVRHVRPERLGVKFIAIGEEDRPLDRTDDTTS